MKIKSKIWIENNNGKVVLAHKYIMGLEAIDRLGSISAAAKDLNISSAGLSKMIKTMEDQLKKKLVTKSKGSKKTAELTDNARKVIRDFNEIDRHIVTQADSIFQRKFLGRFSPVMPVVGLVGLPGVGKNKLASKLIKEFKKRGISTGVVIRESAAGKMSIKPLKALRDGASAAAVSGEKGLTVYWPESEELAPEIVADNHMPGVDLVMVISTEKLNLPCMEIFDRSRQKAPIVKKSKNQMVITGDAPPEGKKRTYIPLNDISGLVDLVEKTAFKDAQRDRLVELKVNGRRVPMLPFVEAMIANAVKGMISSLKSCDKNGEIQLFIRRD